MEAEEIVRDIDFHLIRSVLVRFRKANFDRASIQEILNKGAVSDSDLARFAIAAEARNIRISTLILLVLRTYWR